MKQYRFVLITCILIYCSNPLIEKNDYSVYITGKITNQNGEPAVDAVVSIIGLGLSDTTDDDGVYLITEKKQSLLGKARISNNDNTDTLLIEKDNQRISYMELSSLVDTLPNFTIIQRDIWGELNSIEGYSVGSIKAELFGDGINGIKDIPLWYNEASSSYSGFVYFFYTPGKKNYSIRTIIHDENHAIIGRSPVVQFPSTAGNVKIPTFSTFNPPIIPNKKDTTVSFTNVKTVTIEVDTSKITTQNGIKKIYWGNNSNDWEDSTETPFFEVNSVTGGPKLIHWAVMDYDNLISKTDTFTVFFNRPPENINVEHISYKMNWINNKITCDLHLAVTDPDEENDFLYSFYTGPTYENLSYSGNSSIFSLEADFSDTIFFRLRAYDSFGDSIEITDNFNIPSISSFIDCYNDITDGGNSQVKIDTAQIGINFNFGQKVPKPWGELSPYVGLIVFLDLQKFKDISEYASISFNIKATEEIVVRCKAITPNVESSASSDTGFGNYGYYGKNLTVKNTWENLKVNISGGVKNSGELKLPGTWAKEVDWQPEAVQAFYFEIGQEHNPDLNSGSFWIKDFKLNKE